MQKDIIDVKSYCKSIRKRVMSCFLSRFKVPHRPLQSTTPLSSKYHITRFKVPHHPLQSTTSPSSKYHTTLFKATHHPLQSTTSPSSKYHITLFKMFCFSETRGRRRFDEGEKNTVTKAEEAIRARTSDIRFFQPLPEKVYVWIFLFRI